MDPSKAETRSSLPVPSHTWPGAGHTSHALPPGSSASSSELVPLTPELCLYFAYLFIYFNSFSGFLRNVEIYSSCHSALGQR